MRRPRVRRRSGSSRIAFRTRNSHDGYSAQSAYETMTSSYADYTVDLSSIGPMTGPLTLRIYADQFSSSNYLYVTDFTVNAQGKFCGAIAAKTLMVSSQGRVNGAPGAGSWALSACRSRRATSCMVSTRASLFCRSRSSKRAGAGSTAPPG